MTENNPHAVEADPVIEPVSLLQRSRRAVEWVSYMLVSLTLISLLLLGWELYQANPVFDSFLWSRPWFWLDWSGHFLRACISASLFVCARRYLRELQYLRGQTAPDYEELFLAIDRGWRGLKWSGVALVAHAILFVLNFFGFLHLPKLSNRESRAESLPSRAVTVEFRQADDQPREGWAERSYSVTEPIRKTVFVANQSVIETADIESALVTIDESGSPALSFEMTIRGSAKLQRATTEMIDQGLAIIIDGEVISVPVVRDVAGRHVMVTGVFTKDRAQEIADALNRRQPDR